MPRKSPNAETLKLLYVRSGNECAFTDCHHPIFNDKGVYIAQLCHIKAANKGGQRYDTNQSDEERSAPANLIFMCHRHHKETDCTDEFSVEKLFEMKVNHERNFTEKGKEATREMIRQVLFEINYFWERQTLKTFEVQDLKITRDFDKKVMDLISELSEHIENIQNYCDLCAETDSSESLKSDLKSLFEQAKLDYSKIENIPYYENPFENRNWESHNIRRPNLFSHLSLCLNQLKVKTIEELLKNEPENIELKALLNTSRKEFETEYDRMYYVD